MIYEVRAECLHFFAMLCSAFDMCGWKKGKPVIVEI